MKSQNGAAGLRHEVLDAIQHALALAKLEEPLTDRSIHEIRKQVKRVGGARTPVRADQRSAESGTR
ncbi:MAG TPA: hypothetical protein VFJ70_05225 [Burkholderiales bacterium]|nr:hypothetical protein [Burkholderiales bacterium]